MRKGAFVKKRILMNKGDLVKDLHDRQDARSRKEIAEVVEGALALIVDTVARGGRGGTGRFRNVPDGRPRSPDAPDDEDGRHGRRRGSGVPPVCPGQVLPGGGGDEPGVLLPRPILSPFFFFPSPRIRSGGDDTLKRWRME